MAIHDATPKTQLALDNDVFTDWRNHRPATINAISDYQDRHNFYPKLPAMTVFQARYGFDKQTAKLGALDEQFENSRVIMEQMIKDCGVLEINDRAAAIASYIFARLSASERNRHWADVFIAATALAHDHGVATRNRADFELIGQHLPLFAQDLYLAIWKS
jgi:predicted nucleic acid-binding protein